MGDEKPTWKDESENIHRGLLESMGRHGWPAYGDEDSRFLSLALCGEAGELANKIKKIWRGDAWDPQAIKEEIADVRIYLEQLAKCFGTDADTEAAKKIPELYRRWPFIKPVGNG